MTGNAGGVGKNAGLVKAIEQLTSGRHRTSCDWQSKYNYDSTLDETETSWSHEPGFQSIANRTEGWPSDLIGLLAQAATALQLCLRRQQQDRSFAPNFRKSIVQIPQRNLQVRSQEISTNIWTDRCPTKFRSTYKEGK